MNADLGRHSRWTQMGEDILTLLNYKNECWSREAFTLNTNGRRYSNIIELQIWMLISGGIHAEHKGRRYSNIIELQIWMLISGGIHAEHKLGE